MEQLDVVDSINNAGNWLVRNQALLLSYAVNIVAAIAIIIVGMIVARIVSAHDTLMPQSPISSPRWSVTALSPLR